MVGGEEIRLIPTPGHLESNISVYLPRARILFAGDTVYSGYPPTTRFGHPELWKRWIRSLELIKALNVDKIVPGHGPICGKEEVQRNIEYLGGLLKQKKNLF